MFSFNLFSVDSPGKNWFIFDVGEVFLKNKKGVRFRGHALYIEYGAHCGWYIDFLYLRQYKDKLKTWWARKRSN